MLYFLHLNGFLGTCISFIEKMSTPLRTVMIAQISVDKLLLAR